MIRPFLFLLTLSAASANPIMPPPSLFRDPAFIKEFVGSYGFLSDIEPRVTPDEQAMLGSVRELFEASKFKEAEAAIQEFIESKEKPKDRKSAPEEISPAMIFVLGNLYFQADRGEDARKQFQEAIKRFPRFRRAYTNLGYLYISKNQTDLALPMFQKAIELGESSSRVYGLIGYCHLTRRNPLAAENAYRHAYLLDPSARDWKLGLAQSLMAQEKFAEAASMIGTLIEENPNDKQLWLQQTHAYLALERKEDAAINLEILRLKNLSDENNLNLLGNLYMDRNQPRLALEAYLAAIDKSSTLDVSRALKSARILNDYGHPEKAGEFIVKIRAKLGENIPDTNATALLLAEVRIAQSLKKTDTVGMLLSKLVEIDPANGEVLLELARHHDLLATNEPDEEKRGALIQNARTNYQLALRFENIAYQANLALGQMFVRERRYAEALPLLESALNLKKSDSLEQYTSRVKRGADRQKLKEAKSSS
jgi:tetratricopeptide (TPR) repeat protein